MYQQKVLEVEHLKAQVVALENRLMLSEQQKEVASLLFSPKTVDNPMDNNTTKKFDSP